MPGKSSQPLEAPINIICVFQIKKLALVVGGQPGSCGAMAGVQDALQRTALILGLSSTIFPNTVLVLLSISF